MSADNKKPATPTRRSQLGFYTCELPMMMGMSDFIISNGLLYHRRRQRSAYRRSFTF